MSNLIVRNGQVIFWCRNRDMDIILNSLSRIVEKNSLKNDQNINKFLAALNQRQVGWDRVRCEVFTFFGERSDKTSIMVLFELIGQVIIELEKSCPKRLVFIDRTKQFQRQLLTERTIVAPDSIVENSVYNISDEFKTFFHSLWACNYVVRGDVVIFKSDLTKVLTDNDLAYIEDCLSSGTRSWYKRADSMSLASSLTEISYQEVRNTINELLEYRSPSYAESENRKAILWDLIGRFLPNPVIKVYEWKDYDSRDYVYYAASYFFLTDNKVLWFDMISND